MKDQTEGLPLTDDDIALVLNFAAKESAAHKPPPPLVAPSKPIGEIRADLVESVRFWLPDSQDWVITPEQFARELDELRSSIPAERLVTPSIMTSIPIMQNLVLLQPGSAQREEYLNRLRSAMGG